MHISYLSANLRVGVFRWLVTGIEPSLLQPPRDFDLVHEELTALPMNGSTAVCHLLWPNRLPPRTRIVEAFRIEHEFDTFLW